VVKEEYTNKAIMAEITRVKRAMEKLVKDATDAKAAQTASASLLKEQDKKVSSLATTLSESTSRANDLSSQLETFRASVDSKLAEVLSALNSGGASRGRGGSFDTPPRAPGQGAAGPAPNGARDSSRATNSLS
jgi:septal ring factor EnvC (AmiA/AmiB activator)